jgi:hypothetical protein
MVSVRYIILSFVINESVNRVNFKLHYNCISCNTYSLLHSLGMIVQNVRRLRIELVNRDYGTKKRLQKTDISFLSYISSSMHMVLTAVSYLSGSYFSIWFVSMLHNMRSSSVVICVLQIGLRIFYLAVGCLKQGV